MTAKEQIQIAIQKGIEQIEMVFSPLINAVDIQIGKLEKANLDPTNYYDLEEDEHINYVEIRKIYVTEKEKAITSYLAEMDKEIIALENTPEGAEAPPVSWEKVVFVIIKYALQNGIRIKVGNVEWDSQKPLGGEGSVFDDLRNVAMKSIGIDPESDLGKIIKDPINSAKDLGENIGKETEKALNNANRETEKAVNNIAKVSEKAIADVKKETEKALADARKTAEKAVQDVVKVVSKNIPKIRIKIKKPW
jgi:vacuolar-type H+-ATPase subunit E/Vma4